MEVTASVLILAGATLTLLAAIGLFRFGDLFARMHAATKPATLGLTLILAGVVLVMPGTEPVAKLVLVILLQFVTAPIGAHLLGRAAYRSGERLKPGTWLDEESARLRESNDRP